MITEGLVTDIINWLAECRSFGMWMQVEQDSDAAIVNWLARLGTQLQALHARAAHEATEVTDEDRLIFEMLNNDPRSPFAGMIAPPPAYTRKG
jgi:hypothetical protein